MYVVDDPSEIEEIMKDTTLYPLERPYDERNLRNFLGWLWSSYDLGGYALSYLVINLLLFYLFIDELFS